MCFYVFLCLRYFIHILHLFTHFSSVSLQRHHRVSSLNQTNTRNKECILFDRTKGSLLNLKRSSRATRLRKRSTNKAVHQGNAHKNLNRRCSCYGYDESTVFFSSKRNVPSVRKGWSTETTNHITFWYVLSLFQKSESTLLCCLPASWGRGLFHWTSAPKACNALAARTKFQFGRDVCPKDSSNSNWSRSTCTAQRVAFSRCHEMVNCWSTCFASYKLQTTTFTIQLVARKGSINWSMWGQRHFIEFALHSVT